MLQERTECAPPTPGMPWVERRPAPLTGERRHGHLGLLSSRGRLSDIQCYRTVIESATATASGNSAAGHVGGGYPPTAPAGPRTGLPDADSRHSSISNGCRRSGSARPTRARTPAGAWGCRLSQPRFRPQHHPGLRGPARRRRRPSPPSHRPGPQPYRQPRSASSPPQESARCPGWALLPRPQQCRRCRRSGRAGAPRAGRSQSPRRPLPQWRSHRRSQARSQPGARARSQPPARRRAACRQGRPGRPEG